MLVSVGDSDRLDVLWMTLREGASARGLAGRARPVGRRSWLQRGSLLARISRRRLVGRGPSARREPSPLRLLVNGSVASRSSGERQLPLAVDRQRLRVDLMGQERQDGREGQEGKQIAPPAPPPLQPFLPSCPSRPKCPPPQPRDADEPRRGLSHGAVSGLVRGGPPHDRALLSFRQPRRCDRAGQR